MVALHSQAFKVISGEHDGAEVFIDCLQQRLGSGMVKACRTGVFVASVAIDAYILSGIALASTAKGFNSEHISFFHALSGIGFDEGDLLVAVDFITQDIMPSDTASRSDGNGLSVQFNLVALHDLLYLATDMIHPGIDAGFLDDCVSFGENMKDGVLTLRPVLVAALTAASKLS